MKTAFVKACLLGATIVCCSDVAQDSHAASQALNEEQRWSRELTARLTAEGFAWEWVPAIQSGHIRLVPSERRVLVGLWHPAGQWASDSVVSVSVYRVANIVDAQRWLLRPEPLPEGWQRQPYGLADESWVAEHSSGQIELSFRRGRLVGSVRGKELRSVERAARQIVAFDETQQATAPDGTAR
jgi:hypothetical protein